MLVVAACLAVWFGIDRFLASGGLAREVAHLSDGQAWGLLRPLFHGGDCSTKTTVIRLPASFMEDYVPMADVPGCPSEMSFRLVEEQGVWMLMEKRVIVACGPLELGHAQIEPCKRLYSEYQPLFACDEYDALKAGFSRFNPDPPDFEACVALREASKTDPPSPAYP